uniref:Amino acid permease/ SLC12A domain-containing protein n=1 Tax=Bionectria ochroleuca TaxID=29856 RepID=A0A8H7K152_BIOOC
MPSDKKDDESLRKTGSNKFGDVSAGVVMDEVSHAGGLHRVLGNRQIQLLSAGGAIGTALFISIGAALAKGGPASLFIAFSLFSSVLTCINNSMAEMTTHMPVAGGFALAIPFEITAMTFVFVSSFWSERVTDPGPTAAICAGCIIIYGYVALTAVNLKSWPVTHTAFAPAECSTAWLSKVARLRFWLAIGMQIFICLSLGYTTFLTWDVGSFFASYTMQILMLVLFIAWKLYHKTRMLPAADIDLVWERPLTDAYEAVETEIPTGFWAEMASLIGFRKDEQSLLKVPTPSQT